jgi:hypothetical protein
MADQVGCWKLACQMKEVSGHGAATPRKARCSKSGSSGRDVAYASPTVRPACRNFNAPTERGLKVAIYNPLKSSGTSPNAFTPPRRRIHQQERNGANIARDARGQADRRVRTMTFCPPSATPSSAAVKGRAANHPPSVRCGQMLSNSFICHLLPAGVLGAEGGFIAGFVAGYT